MWPGGWCLTMAGPPDPPVGPSGATTGYWCLVRPYSMGGRRGEKKAHEPMGGAVLAWAREALSGSAAVDARSEGPDCVLSAVEKRHDHRVWERCLPTRRPRRIAQRFWDGCNRP